MPWAAARSAGSPISSPRIWISRRPRSTASRRFWRAPHMAQREGLKAVQMFEAIERGEIKALWVMATNPAVSLPRAARRARGACASSICSSSRRMCCRNDTVNAGAHILLPAAAWGEKDGTVTNSERRISRQRPFLPLPGEARPDWWIVAQVARRMGFGDAFAYRLRGRCLPRARGAVGLRERRRARFRYRRAGAARATRSSTRSIRCNGRRARATRAGDTRFFADGGFFTPDRKARLIAPERPAPQRRQSAQISRSGSIPAACATSGTP